MRPRPAHTDPRDMPVFKHATSPAEPASMEYQVRLMEAMATALTDKSYAQLTIADIVAQARVSKRTFYENFASKQECLLALCRHVSDHIMIVVLGCLRPGVTWAELVRDVTRAYLSAIKAQPVLMRSLYLEIFAAGADGLAVRREISLRFGDMLRAQVDAACDREGGLKPLSAPLATAVVAGINDMILQLIEQGREDRLMTLAAPAAELVLAVTRSA